MTRNNQNIANAQNIRDGLNAAIEENHRIMSQLRATVASMGKPVPLPRVVEEDCISYSQMVELETSQEAKVIPLWKAA